MVGPTPRSSVRILLALLVISGLVSLACQPATPAQTAVASVAPQPAGPVKITIATSAEPPTADFHQASLPITHPLAANIADGLVQLDEKYQIQPALAVSWRVENPKSWVFDLRKGVKFHDGTPFNAAAVKYNFERLFDPATQSRDAVQYGPIARVVEVDEYTIRFELKEAFAPLLRLLAYIAGKMASPTAAKAAGVKDFGRRPVYTGAYQLTEWVTGDHLTLKANKDYWGGAPKIDEIVWKFVPESSSRTALIRAGDIDFIEAIDPSDLASVRNDANLVVNRVLPFSWNFVGMNLKIKPFDDVRVRRAVNYAIDRDALIKSVLLGGGESLNQPVSPGVQGYAVSFQGYTYDPPKAKQLLAEAGFPNGFDTELWYATGYTTGVKPLSEAIQGQLAAVGIRAKIVVNDITAWSVARREGKIPLIFMNWGTSNADTHTALFLAFHTTQQAPVGANYSLYSNSRVDEILKKGVEVAESERDGVYRQAVPLIMDDAPWAMVNQLVLLEVRKKGLENVGHRAWFFYLGSATVKR